MRQVGPPAGKMQSGWDQTDKERIQSSHSPIFSGEQRHPGFQTGVVAILGCLILEGTASVRE
ncbi:MAG: hypothetical protein CMO80_05695 [Verrucomicrobiales bacterium]|nr:hypothetical protein [Verrucomicrobiales bacterium]